MAYILTISLRDEIVAQILKFVLRNSSNHSKIDRKILRQYVRDAIKHQLTKDKIWVDNKGN